MSECRGLLIDSCGATARVALFDREHVLAEGAVQGRGFSAEWPAVVRGLLRKVGWTLGEVQVVAVVHGPGSFTGVRVGLAAAKGLCEANGAKLIAVSRLEVLAKADGAADVVGIDAGRGEVYVRQGGVESLMKQDEYGALLAQRAGNASGLVTDEAERDAALKIVAERWDAGQFDDVATVDANYVRGEREIYARKVIGA